MGDESMKIMAKNGESVNGKGIYPPIPDIEKVRMIDLEDFDTKGFLKRKTNVRRFLCSKVSVQFCHRIV